MANKLNQHGERPWQWQWQHKSFTLQRVAGDLNLWPGSRTTDGRGGRFTANFPFQVRKDSV